MLDYNQYLIEHGGPKERFEGKFGFKMYSAVSISDFIDERKKVQTTSFLKSVIWLPLTFTSLHNKTVVFLYNVQFYHSGENEAILADQNATLNLPITPLLNSRIKRGDFFDGEKFQRVYVLYSKEQDYGCLFKLEKFIDLESPRKQEDKLGLEGLLPQGS